jgi:tetratricopeptide (TPR) repeat protein
VGYLFLTAAFNATGRPAEALAAAEKFIRLDPRERGVYLWFQCLAYSQLGHWQEAVSIVKRLPPPTSPWPHVWLAVDYVELGRDDAAKAEIAEVLKLEPQFSLKLGLAAFPTEQTRAGADLRKAGLK